MICGTLSGPSGLAVGFIAVAALLALSFTLLRSPQALLSFSHRYDAWLSSKVRVLRLVLWPRHWLESRLEQLGVAPAIIRAWGVVFGVVGLCLLGLLAISVVRPCA